MAKLKRLFIQELKPSLNVDVSNEKLLLYELFLLMMSRQINVLLQTNFLALQMKKKIPASRKSPTPLPSITVLMVCLLYNKLRNLSCSDNRRHL